MDTELKGMPIRRATYDAAYERATAWLQEIGMVELDKIR